MSKTAGKDQDSLHWEGNTKPRQIIFWDKASIYCPQWLNNLYCNSWYFDMRTIVSNELLGKIKEWIHLK